MPSKRKQGQPSPGGPHGPQPSTAKQTHEDEHAAALLALGSPAEGTAEGEQAGKTAEGGEAAPAAAAEAAPPAAKKARVVDDGAAAIAEAVADAVPPEAVAAAVGPEAATVPAATAAAVATAVAAIPAQELSLEPPPLPGAAAPAALDASSLVPVPPPPPPARTTTRDDKWNEMYDDLVRYQTEQGHCLVPGRHARLGPWVQIQRSQHRLLRDGKPSTLTEERVTKLENLGFAWQIQKDRDECWTDMYNELLAYKEREGHTNVPSTSREYAKLGSWTKRQRMTHRLLQEGKPSPMKREWVEKLTEIGFEFEGGRKVPAAGRDDEEEFRMRLEELKEFKDKHGHCLVPESYPANESLGKWAAQKRKQHKRVEEGKSSKLTPDRIKAMDALEFVWTVWGNRTEKWEEMFEELKAYRDRVGSCRVPLRDSTHRKLGMWVDRQKTNYRLLKAGQQSPMTSERVVKLESIGFEWQITDREYEADSWNKRLEELREYRDQMGNTLVPRNYEKNKKLGRWVDHQRQQYRNRLAGKLTYMSDEKLKKLEAVDFVWSPPPQSTDQWTQNFEELAKFHAANGHCRVPYHYPENPGLGTWVETLRTQYWRIKRNRPSRLTEDRIKKLEGLQFEWEVPPDEAAPRTTGRGSWNARFEELRQYKTKEGHCNVPNNYPQNKKLGSFVKKQREDYRLLQAGKHSPMKPERIKQLETLGFQWQVVDREYYQDSWARRFEELKEFKNREGHCFVPRQFDENQKLAYWVERQRQDYRNLQKGKPSKMTPERVKVLEEVGFAWSASDRKKLNVEGKDQANAAASGSAVPAASSSAAAPAVMPALSHGEDAQAAQVGITGDSDEAEASALNQGKADEKVDDGFLTDEKVDDSKEIVSI